LQTPEFEDEDHLFCGQVVMYANKKHNNDVFSVRNDFEANIFRICEERNDK